VDLLPENEDVADVFMAVRGQILSAEISKNRRMITLSIPAVESAIRMKGIRDQWSCLQTIMLAWHYLRAEQDDGGD